MKCICLNQVSLSLDDNLNVTRSKIYVNPNYIKSFSEEGEGMIKSKVTLLNFKDKGTNIFVEETVEEIQKLLYEVDNKC